MLDPEQIKEDLARRRQAKAETAAPEKEERQQNDVVAGSEKPQPRALPPHQPRLEPRPEGRESSRPLTPQIAHAPEAELYALSALAQFPKTCFPLFTEKGANPELFWIPAHRALLSLLSDFYEEHRHVDGVAFMQHALDGGHTAGLGGPGLIASLWTRTSSPESFGYHIDILRDKYVAREAARLSSSLASKVITAGEDELWTIIGDHERAISDLRAMASDKLEGVENFAYSDLINFDASKDEAVLLGAQRWLGRGYTCLWAGGSGYGKSTLEMQAALYWATGTSLFGIKPVRPLKSLIIQAENDLGDTGEQFQGVIAGIKATGDVNLNGEVERMIIVNRLIGCVGDAFLSRLKSLLKLHKPDLVWIDPLFAFAGCDLVDTEAISRFLREGLIPIAVEHQVCAHVIHHISKPARENDTKKSWTSFDYQFLGFGSSEIQNAFRAVNILIPVSGHDGVFRLVLSKRGSRAGAKDVDGETTTSLYLAHSKKGGMLWSQVEQPEDTNQPRKSGQFIKSFVVDDVLEQMSVVHGLKTSEFAKHVMTETGMSRATFYRLFDQLKKDEKIRLDAAHGWVKKSPTTDV